MFSDSQLIDWLEKTSLMEDGAGGYRVHYSRGKGCWVISDSSGPLYYRDTLRLALSAAVREIDLVAR